VTSTDDSGRASRHEDEVKSLTAQISFLDEEIAVLRRRLADSPRQVKLLEDRLRETESSLTGVTAQNERLAATLREARDQIVALKEEVDRLAQPPSGFGVFLNAYEDDTADVFTGGRKMRVNVSPNVELSELRPGQEVVLNEALNVIVAQGYESIGEVVMLKELLDGGDRVLVLWRNDEEKVARLAESLIGSTLQVGDSLLLDLRSGYVYERIPRTELQELLLEEIPDSTYSEIGGLAPQIEQIRDAIELPYLRPDLFRRLRVTPPKGVFLYGPPGCGKTLIAKAVASSLAKQVAARIAALADGESAAVGVSQGKTFFFNIKGPELLNKYVGETERQIRLIFQRAREKASEGMPVIVFFDEMDSLFRTRGSGVSTDMETTIVPQLLSEIDGVEGLKNVIVIGATNREDMIDPAILRPGRLDVKIKIGRPREGEAREILEKYLTPDLPFQVRTADEDAIRRARYELIQELVSVIFNDASPEMQIAEVTFDSGHQQRVSFSSFLSGALLREIVDRAKSRSMKRALAGEELVIQGRDLREALLTVASQTKELLNTTRFEDWAWISGAQGEDIKFIRTLSPYGEPGRSVVPDIQRIKWGG
jgi:proteasome-associated ATPase